MAVKINRRHCAYKPRFHVVDWVHVRHQDTIKTDTDTASSEFTLHHENSSVCSLTMAVAGTCFT